MKKIIVIIGPMAWENQRLRKPCLPNAKNAHTSTPIGAEQSIRFRLQRKQRKQLRIIFFAS